MNCNPKIVAAPVIECGELGDVVTAAGPTRHLVCELAVSAIKRSPENDHIYSRISWDNHDDRELYDQIVLADRILEPLILSGDGFLLSGHRRLACAVALGWQTVPTITEHSVLRSDYTSSDWMRKLLSYNSHRNKSLSEIAREAVVQKSAENAYLALVESRLARDAEIEIGEMPLADCRARKKLSGEKSEMIKAILEIMEQHAADRPFGIRRLHYLTATREDKVLKNTNPKRWAKMRHRKNGKLEGDEYYRLDHWSSADLSSVVTRMRSDKLVPWDWFIDETRPSDLAMMWDGASEYIGWELERLFGCYRRNLLKSQPYHFEVLLEKLGLRHILKPVCDRYGMQLTIGRGYSSSDVAYRMAERFRRSGKERLVLLVMSDHDPDGLCLGDSVGNNLLRDQHLRRDRLVSVRVGLTPEQARELNLPTNNEPKDVPRSKKYIEQHGRVIWELDAASPDFLRSILDEAIRSRIDVDLFNQELRAEKEEARFIDAYKQQALHLLSQIELDAGAGQEGAAE